LGNLKIPLVTLATRSQPGAKIRRFDYLALQISASSARAGVVRNQSRGPSCIGKKRRDGSD